MAIDMDRRLFFVVGPPRSGSTLLMRMLNVHPDIYTRPETHLLTPLAHLGYFDYVQKAPYDPFQAHQSVRAFVGDLPGAEQDYLDALRGYADTMYGRMLEPTGRRYFVDKTPAYGLILPFLAKLYPNAVFVVLTRHPFAVFSSYANSFFDGDFEAAHDFNPIVERYVPAMARFLRERPVPMHHVCYETLVQDPEGTLQKLCAHADLTYTPEMIDYGQKEVDGKGLGDPIGVAQHSRPTTASVHKWATLIAGRADVVSLLQRMVAHLSDEDLEAWGTPREALWAPLEAVDPEKAKAAQSKGKKWDRYHVERRLLLHLRRGIHDRPLGRFLQKVRFFCDVMLRE